MTARGGAPPPQASQFTEPAECSRDFDERLAQMEPRLMLQAYVANYYSDGTGCCSDEVRDYLANYCSDGENCCSIRVQPYHVDYCSNDADCCSSGVQF